jgi:hypothetical protein
MRPLISSKTAATIDRLRVAGWQAALTTSDPQVALVLYPLLEDAPRDPQDVVMKISENKGLESGEGTGAGQTTIEVTFHRPIVMGFSVELDDRFTVEGMSGTITRIWEAAGMIWVLGAIDAGTT